MLEVILALGLAVVLMAALQQSLAMLLRYQRAAQEQVQEAHLARTLLFRIAEELRTTMPPLATEASVRPLRTLVDLARSPLDQPIGLEFGSFAPDPSAGTFAPDQGEQATLDSLMALNQLNAVILGGPDRLLLVHRPPVLTPMRRHLFPDFEEGNPTDPTGSMPPLGGRGADAGTIEDQLRSAGVLTQVLYFLRPLEDSKMAHSQGSPSQTENWGADQGTGWEAGWGTTEEPRPAVQGLFRQEVTLPIAPIVQFEARAQLEDLLRETGEEEARGAGPPSEADPGQLGPSTEGDPSEDARRFVSTRLLLTDLTCIRFRYHNGFAWQDRWERVDRLPLAVEIRLSFDPRAADPEFLNEYLEEENMPTASTGFAGGEEDASGLEAGLAPDLSGGLGPSAGEDPFADMPTATFDDPRVDRPVLFPYRLVVHLPHPPTVPGTLDWRPPDLLPEGAPTQELQP